MARPRARQSGSPNAKDPFPEAVSDFGKALKPKMNGDGRSEDRLRHPVHDLIERLAPGVLGTQVRVHEEVPLAELNSRPDMAVDSAAGRIGFIELKAPGKGTPPDWRGDKRDRQQWEKFRNLPNLIYTDGTSWRLFRKGEPQGAAGKLTGDLSRAGAKLVAADDAFERVIRDFLLWGPDRPKSLRGIVAEVAPLCGLLRDQVLETLRLEGSQAKRDLGAIAEEWRMILFPSGAQRADSAAASFADAYAQAVTFGLLLARVDGISFDGRSPNSIAEQLSKQHSLLGSALRFLAQHEWVQHLNVVDMLVRMIGNINWSEADLDSSDVYAGLYETFLDHYDAKLRQSSGTYYTPVPVARSIVSFLAEILQNRFGKQRGFAAEDVVVLDPAMGAGTFLAEVLHNAVQTVQEERRSVAVPEAHVRELFGNRLVGFEMQVAPFAVAELRLHSMVRNGYGIELPPEEPRFLTDTLEDPSTASLELGKLYETLLNASEQASRYKREVPVMVVLGNPPWRERAHGAAPWITRRRDEGHDSRSARPSMDEFKLPGKGKLDYNLANLWTYFWRWSAWKAFDAKDSGDPAGVVALITPSSYVTSDAYAGMRQYLRETADEGWIIDLAPEQHRPDPQTRIFPTTQHRICIGVFVRTATPQTKDPATVHYTALHGTRQQKFDQLAQLSLHNPVWQDCPQEWEAPFRPGDAGWQRHPLLTELLPWRQPGVKANRNWFCAPNAETLRQRWSTLVGADSEHRRTLFKETRDRKVSDKCPPVPGVPGSSTPVSEADQEPGLATLAARSFDRQYILHDRRLIDYPRPELWQAYGPEQIYVSEQHNQPLPGSGPGLVFSAVVPDMHYFDNRGGRVLPLFRDATATVPNMPPKLLGALRDMFEFPVAPTDLLAYIAGVVAHSGYTARFQVQLQQPKIRLPITRDRVLWTEAVELGRRVIWLHTYGERMVDATAGRPADLSTIRRARYVEPVPTGEGRIPVSYGYEGNQTLRIGEDTSASRAGRVHPVREEVLNYNVGQLQVVHKWLDYRCAEPKYKRETSELDRINPTRWTAEFDDQLLDLLDVLEELMRLEPAQAQVLERICSGPLVHTDELIGQGVLPAPAAFTKPPRGDQPDLLS